MPSLSPDNPAIPPPCPPSLGFLRQVQTPQGGTACGVQLQHLHQAGIYLVTFFKCLWQLGVTDKSAEPQAPPWPVAVAGPRETHREGSLGSGDQDEELRAVPGGVPQAPRLGVSQTKCHFPPQTTSSASADSAAGVGMIPGSPSPVLSTAVSCQFCLLDRSRTSPSRLPTATPWSRPTSLPWADAAAATPLLSPPNHLCFTQQPKSSF